MLVHIFIYTFFYHLSIIILKLCVKNYLSQPQIVQYLCYTGVLAVIMEMILSILLAVLEKPLQVLNGRVLAYCVQA